VTANWIFVVFAIIAAGSTVACVPKEEQMRIEEFGEEYTTYMEKTGRFFPS
jgi:protein-S-isoprenylcysteine O-methyltransferase Ste14